MRSDNLTQAELCRMLCYNPLSGNFMWKISPPFSRVRIGSIAGTIHGRRRGKRLYRIIKIHKRRYAAHRLAFLYMKDYWPREIDHKDGDGLNNRWLNLRECTHSQNMANQNPQKRNKLGIKGVYYNKADRKYQAHIRKNGKAIYLGQYDTPEAAARAYRTAAKRYFGEFASGM